MMYVEWILFWALLALLVTTVTAAVLFAGTAIHWLYRQIIRH